MLCVVRLCTSTPFASPVEVHLQQGDHLRSGHALLCRRNERRRRGRECCGGSGVCHLLGKWNGGAQQHCWPRACEWAVRWGRAVSRGEVCTSSSAGTGVVARARHVCGTTIVAAQTRWRWLTLGGSSDNLSTRSGSALAAACRYLSASSNSLGARPWHEPQQHAVRREAAGEG